MVSFMSMGIFSRGESKQSLKAQNAPQVLGDQFMPYASFNNLDFTAVTRLDAMSVPAIKRCRDLIAGTISTIPLEYYKKSTG